MSNEQDQSKTEEATSHKIDEARKKGMVARSTELSTFVVICTFAAVLLTQGSAVGGKLAQLSVKSLSQAPSLSFSHHQIVSWVSQLIGASLYFMVPVFGAIMVAAALSILIQTGFVFAPLALKPDFSRLNPANGFKKLFSVQLLYEAFKSTIKLLVLGTVTILVISSIAMNAASTFSDPGSMSVLLRSSVVRLLFSLLAATAVFVAIDWTFTRWQYGKKLRMSRRELKDEVKQREGDGRIKQRRRQLQQELAKRIRSMRRIKGADLMLVNPTHFAVALKYDRLAMISPQVVSRGSGEFALRLRRLALLYRVPVIEDKALTQKLFFKVPIDHPIPEQFYQSVAKHYLKLMPSNPVAVNSEVLL